MSESDAAESNAERPTIAESEPASGAASSAAGNSPPVKGRVRKSRKAIASLAELLDAVYAGRGALPKLTQNELVAIQARPTLDPVEREHLLHLSTADRTLERTRLLMVLAMERLYASPAQGPTREFVGTVLQSHPAFSAPGLIRVIRGDPGAPEEDVAARTLTSRLNEPLAWSGERPPLSKAELAKCRANSLACLLLWLRETNGIPLERVLRCLHANIWARAGRRQKTERQKMSALIGARDGAAAAVAYEILDAQLAEKSQESTSARMSEERASIRVTKAEAAVADLQDRLESTVKARDVLADELKNERKERTVEATHFRDDYQKLRGRLLQRLQEEISLLDEGLGAIRRDPPKVHVMVDHANRVIDGLRREMDRLKE